MASAVMTPPEAGALESLFAGIDSQLRFDDDYVAQGLTMLRELKALAGEGIWSHPRLLDIVPAPPFEALQRTFDLLVPNGSAMIDAWSSERSSSIT